MKTYAGPSLVPTGQDAARKPLRPVRPRLRRATVGAAALCGLLWLSACGQKGPLSLPPAKAPPTAASSPAR